MPHPAPHPADTSIPWSGRLVLALPPALCLIALLIKLGATALVLAGPGWLHAHSTRPAPADTPGPPPAAAAPAVAPIWQRLPEAAPSPSGAPASPALVALGERLFHDTRLSRDGTVACASCHDLARHAGADGRPTARGIGGRIGPRNTPTVWNAAFQTRLFWDGRADSLEAQAAGPLFNPAEMGMPSAAALEQRLARDATYEADFAQAFGGPGITLARTTQAIAAFERTLITRDSPYDRFLAGDRHALSPQQLAGMERFQALGCINCHAGPNFSSAGILSPGGAWRAFPAHALAGAQHLTQDPGLAPPGSRPGVWRVPSLRNVALTGPYFHNGSVRTLDEAVRIMASAQLGLEQAQTPGPARRVLWSQEQQTLTSLPPRTFSRQDVADIVAFLHALSSERLARARQP